MSKKTNRVCKTCQTSYYFCPTCSNVTAVDKYKKMFCSKNCRDIFQTVASYSAQHITKDEAHAKLEQLDLLNMSNFVEQVKSDVESIIKVETSIVIPTELIPVEDNSVIFEEIVVEHSESNKKHKRHKKHETNIDAESMPE